MSWWQRLLRRPEMEEKLDKELQFHLDQHTYDLIARGVSPSEARRRARMSIGGPEQAKEECRDARGTRWVEDFGRTSVTRCECCGSVLVLRPWRF